MISAMLPYALLIFILDRVTKWLVVEWLDLKTILYYEVWSPFLNFTMAWNRGINFGLFNLGDEGRYILIALSMGIVLFVLVWTRRMSGRLLAIGVGCLIGGALGNIWDRVQYGAVADFLNMSCCGIRNPFAFNVADIAIFAGAVILIIYAERGTPDTHSNS
jgi:signal peptidase II